MYQLLCLPYQFLATEILDRFTVRIHSRIVEKGRSWARLWYLLRGLDSQGSGYICLPAALPIGLLATSSSTLRQWLREGKEAGAFRRWRIRQGILRVALGGLFKVCRSLGLAPDKRRKGIAPWGVTSQIPLHQVQSLQTLRAAATVATAQRLQQLSRFSAWRNLPAPARKSTRLPQPEAFFVEGQRASDDSARGAIRCCIHISRKRIWASKGFIPFGASQSAIAQERKICDRTVQRHLNLMGIDRRQIVQSKGEYRVAANAISHDAGSIGLSDDFALVAREDDYYLSERSGGGQLHTHKVASVGFSAIHSRFFQYGAKPKIWLYRCNIYEPVMTLCTMSAARARYRRGNVLQNERAGGGTTLCNAPLKSLENFPEVNAIPAEKG